MLMKWNSRWWSRFAAARAASTPSSARSSSARSDVVEQLLISLFAGGHCLITGAPGLAKTLLVRSIAQIFHLKFQRIQFTPDLMPADITGTEILEQEQDGHRRMQFVQGPDLRQHDPGRRDQPHAAQDPGRPAGSHAGAPGHRRRHALSRCEEPFFVLATQNPIEMEGTYPLPEAQLDRFMFNVVIDYLPEDDEVAVVKQTTSRRPAPIEPLFTGEDVRRFHDVVQQRADRRRRRSATPSAWPPPAARARTARRASSTTG